MVLEVINKLKNIGIISITCDEQTFFNSKEFENILQDTVQKYSLEQNADILSHEMKNIILEFEKNNQISDSLKSSLKEFENYPQRCLLTFVLLLEKIFKVSIPDPTSLYGYIDEENEYEINLKWCAPENQDWISIIIIEEDIQVNIPIQTDEKLINRSLLLFEHNIENIDKIATMVIEFVDRNK